MILQFLASQPSSEKTALLAEGIVKGDADVTDAGLKIIEDWVKNKPLAKEVNLIQHVKYITSGLSLQMGPASDKSKYIDRVLALARLYRDDKHVGSTIERLEKLKKRLETAKSASGARERRH